MALSKVKNGLAQIFNGISEARGVWRKALICACAASVCCAALVTTVEAQTKKRGRVRGSESRKSKAKSNRAEKNATPAARQPTQADSIPAKYDVDLNLDFDARLVTGRGGIVWTNNAKDASSQLYFQLYPNLRPSKQSRSENIAAASIADKAASGAAVLDSPPAARRSTTANEVEREAPMAMPANGKPIDAARDLYATLAPELARINDADEPLLEIIKVEDANSQQALSFSLEERATVLRVNLGREVKQGETAHIEIEFRARVPLVEAEETGLLAHVVGQVDAALRDGRETRRAREMLFASRGVMLLAAPFPVLAVRDGNSWRRARVPLSVGRVLHTESADYKVRVQTQSNVKIVASTGEATEREIVKGNVVPTFRATARRDFVLLAGRDLQTLTATEQGVRLRSIYLTGHETSAARALEQGREAVRIFTRRYGALPANYEINVAEAPLVAGRGFLKFAGMCAIASAFYVDFDAPAFRNLPEIVREQRASLEETVEWSIASGIAHQWWGAQVGTDTEREPVVEEALTQSAALDYFRTRYGVTRAAQIERDHLRGVYAIYRTFGGTDAPANRAASDYRNSFQFAAIVSAKGALMLEKLRAELGEAIYFRALASFYNTHRTQRASLDDLRQAFLDEVAAAPTTAPRRSVNRLFNRWLNERHGDADIAPPNPQLARALGLPVSEPTVDSDGATNAPLEGKAIDDKTFDDKAEANRNRFSRFGLFFWRQMTRIR